MKNKSIDLLSNIMSKRHEKVFLKTFLKTFFFKYEKNWKRAGIWIWHILEDHLFEMIEI